MLSIEDLPNELLVHHIAPWLSETGRSRLSACSSRLRIPLRPTLLVHKLAQQLHDCITARMEELGGGKATMAANTFKQAAPASLILNQQTKKLFAEYNHPQTLDQSPPCFVMQNHGESECSPAISYKVLRWGKDPTLQGSEIWVTLTKDPDARIWPVYFIIPSPRMVPVELEEKQHQLQAHILKDFVRAQEDLNYRSSDVTVLPNGALLLPIAEVLPSRTSERMAPASATQIFEMIGIGPLNNPPRGAQDPEGCYRFALQGIFQLIRLLDEMQLNRLSPGNEYDWEGTKILRTWLAQVQVQISSRDMKNIMMMFKVKVLRDRFCNSVLSASGALTLIKSDKQ